MIKKINYLLNNILFIITLLIIISLTFNESLTRYFTYSFILGGILIFCLKKIKRENISFPLTKPLLVFFITFLISLFFSSDFYSSQKFFFSIMINYFMLLLVPWMIIDKIQKLKLIFLITIISLLIVMGDAFYQYVSGYSFFIGYPLINDSSVSLNKALTASFGHYNQLGEFVGSMLLGLWFFIIFYKNLKVKLIFIILFIFGIPVLIFTYSRGSWVAFGVGLILITLYLAFLNRSKKYCIYLIAILIFLVLIFSLLTKFSPSLLGRFKLLVKLDSAGRIDNIYKEAIKTFLKYPLFGIGLNNSFKIIRDINNTHNIWLEVLVTTGLTGFLGFLYFMIFYFKKILDGIKKTIQTTSFPYIIFFFSIYIFVLLHNLTDLSIIDGWDLGIFFWLINGILLKGVYLDNDGRQ